MARLIESEDRKMARLPDFRKIVYLGMTADGEEVLLPEKADYLTLSELKKISPPYERGFDLDKLRQRQKKLLKAPKSASTPAVTPKEPDRPPEGQPAALPTAINEEDMLTTNDTSDYPKKRVMIVDLDNE